MPKIKQDTLKLIADNQLLFDYVKEVVSDEFKFTNTDKLDGAISNEKLGEKVRARIQGLAMVESAFLKIAQLRTGAQTPQSTNPGR